MSLTPHLPLTSSQGQRWHLGSEPFGRPWQSGDVVGCMIDLTENTIIFTLNGEVLMSDSGSETAFRDIEIGDGEGWPRGPSSPRLFHPLFPRTSSPWLPPPRPPMLTPAHLSPPTRLPACVQLGTRPGGSLEPGPGRELPAVLCHLWPPGRF